MPRSICEVTWTKYESARRKNRAHGEGRKRRKRVCTTRLLYARAPPAHPARRAVREQEEKEKERRVVHRKRPNDMADEAAGFGERAAPAAVR